MSIDISRKPRGWAEVKGFIKLLILKILEEQPLHGYGIMKKLEELMGFKPSSGVIYPLLRSLLMSGLVRVAQESTSGRKTKIYELTDKGRQFLKENNQKVVEALRFAQSLKKFKEVGGQELGEIIRLLIRRILELSEDKLREVSVAIREFCTKIRSILEGV